MSADYYSILGIGRSATADEIRKAYRRLALIHHPDRNPDDPQSAERFRKIHEAYIVLSDLRKRAAWDQGRSGYYQGALEQVVFLDAEVDASTVKLNEEISLIFRFGAEGRFFRKPDLRGFFIASGPLIDHRMAMHNGSMVRETVLRYVICPVVTGEIELGPATISYAHVPVSSNKLRLQVTGNRCYFSKDNPAGSQPLKIYLHKQQLSSNTIYAKMMVIEHAVLIPRSDVVAWYHKTGRIIKIATAACGTAWALVHDQGAVTGAVLGSLVGGINCHLMYRMTGIKSRFYYADRYPLVQEYISEGYLPGREPNEGMIGSRVLSFIKSLFI